MREKRDAVDTHSENVSWCRKGIIIMYIFYKNIIHPDTNKQHGSLIYGEFFSFTNPSHIPSPGYHVQTSPIVTVLS